MGDGIGEGRVWDLAFNLYVGLGGSPTPTLKEQIHINMVSFYT